MGEVNKEVITVQDCIEMLEMKNETAIINDGVVLGFEKAEPPMN